MLDITQFIRITIAVCGVVALPKFNLYIDDNVSIYC